MAQAVVKTPAIPANVHRARVERVIAHMRASLDAPLRLDDLARLADLSPFYFDRVFTSLTGVSAVAFHASLRLDAAKRALLADDRPITDVCFELGYESLGSFTTRFGQAVGLAPSAFRARVAQLRDVDVLPYLRAVAGQHRDERPDGAVRVVLRNAPYDDALVWVGAFPRGIPDRAPNPGRMALGNAEVELGPIADGTHHILAASYRASSSIADYLVQHERMRVATSGPIAVGAGESGPLTLGLRDLIVTDPPILLALPLFSLRTQDVRSPP